MNRIVLILAILLGNVVAFAQDKGLDVNVEIDKGGEGWYVNPVYWIVGAAVFILLLVAISRGSGRSTAD